MQFLQTMILGFDITDHLLSSDLFLFLRSVRNRSVRRLLVAACVVPSSPIFVTLMKEAPGSSET
jgi:hypothetical protein